MSGGSSTSGAGPGDFLTGGQLGDCQTWALQLECLPTRRTVLANKRYDTDTNYQHIDVAGSPHVNPRQPIPSIQSISPPLLISGLWVRTARRIGVKPLVLQHFSSYLSESSDRSVVSVDHQNQIWRRYQCMVCDVKAKMARTMRMCKLAHSHLSQKKR